MNKDLLNTIKRNWKELCEGHARLFQHTVEEYSILLKNDIASLEKKLKEKVKTIKDISHIDKQRKLNISLIKNKDVIITNFNSFIKAIENSPYKELAEDIKSYNIILLELIKKIQEQNKKNQLFLKKAMIFINNLQNDFKGIKENETIYTKKGNKINLVSNTT